MNLIGKQVFSLTVMLAACEPALCQSPPMHVAARVNEETVKVRKGPGAEHGQSRLITRGAQVIITAREGSWLHVTLANGDSGWIWSKFVNPEKPAAVPQAAKTESEDAAETSGTRAESVAGSKSAVSLSGPIAKPVPAAAAAVAPSVAAPKRPVEVSKDVLDALSGTKPDILGGAKESPAASAGDSFRVLIVLLPILGGIVLAVKGLKAAQERTGRVPDLRKGLRGAILGGFNLNNARKNGGSTIRVLESIPLGSASLHLVEVRGKVLLLGAAGNSLINLADVSDSSMPSDSTGDDSFRSILNNMSDDLVEDYSDLRGDLGTVVGSLDDRIRETTEAIARTAVRSRR